MVCKCCVDSGSKVCREVGPPPGGSPQRCCSYLGAGKHMFCIVAVYFVSLQSLSTGISVWSASDR